MKKRWMMLVLCAVLALALTACGSKKEDSAQDEIVESTVDSSTEESTEESVEEAETTEDTVTEDTAQTSGDTLGQTLLAAFVSATGANAEASAQELADTLLSNEAILFSGASMPVEPGLLTGFGNAEITGFKEGVAFMPMIGTIPFVGYVFTLEDGTDADAFMQTLTDNADPRWNICTEAEETIVEKAGNTVFFLMCPKSLEE